MKSNVLSPDDLAAFVPTAEEGRALARAWPREELSFANYLIWLAAIPSPPIEELRSDPGPRGEEFVLPFP